MPVGPFDGARARTWDAEPGRLAVDDLEAGRPGAGWVEPAGARGGLSFVRLSTTELGDAALGELLDHLTAGTDLIVEIDPDDRARIAAAQPEVTAVPALRLTNSLGRRQERFVALVPGHVGMYSCGPTVYSYQHLGNMRAYVFVDSLKRALRWRGYDVRHVINITDVGHLLADADQGDDKVEEASRREGRSVAEITGHYAEVYWEDLRALHVTSPDEWPHASAYVPQMINFAMTLAERGFGYPLDAGLYFDTARQPDYGELAGIAGQAQRETGRVDAIDGKRSSSDFALWRTFTDGRERLMQWESPWGTGAPGWHLECSVMAMALLGDHFDIHTGGIDHRELHHVNEIAQSEAYLGDGRPWVRYWMHNEFLNFKGAKMAKSAGGTLRLADLVALGVHPLAFRYLLLGSHYGSQMDFTEKLAQAAHVALKRLAVRVRAALGAPAGPELDEPVTLLESLDGASGVLRERLLALDTAVAEDLLTPTVLALVSEWSRSPQELSGAEWARLVRAVNTLTGLSLGVLAADDFAPPLPESVDAGWVEERLAARDEARAARDWPAADRVRNELAAVGVRIEDTPEGSHWFVAER
ncbi:MAG: cysteine--tRNA ligase [Acidimicrobiales bacterium]